LDLGRNLGISLFAGASNCCTGLGASNDRFECRVLVGDPFLQIMAGSRTNDLVVMTTAGRTGLSHLMIGSVAEKVVRHPPVPVLTNRPSAMARKAARLRGPEGRR
jgi:nucleotide-binding universal stress UspA family protein